MAGAVEKAGGRAQGLDTCIAVGWVSKRGYPERMRGLVPSLDSSYSHENKVYKQYDPRYATGI